MIMLVVALFLRTAAAGILLPPHHTGAEASHRITKLAGCHRVAMKETSWSSCGASMSGPLPLLAKANKPNELLFDFASVRMNVSNVDIPVVNYFIRAMMASP
jgi:hypothetical protein